MDTQAMGKMWLVWALVALVIGAGGGYWYGREAGMASEKARSSALLAERERAAAKAVNPFEQTAANPFEKNPANPFENVKVNPFE